jgi:hypothetical protein
MQPKSAFIRLSHTLESRELVHAKTSGFISTTVDKKKFQNINSE